MAPAWRCYKPPPQLLLFGGGFLGLFAGFVPIQTFLAITHPDAATVALSLLYFVFALACIPVPWLVARYGARGVTCAGGALYLVFEVAAALESDALLVVTSVVCGVGSGALWTASGVVVTELSTPETRGKNSGVFLSMFRMNLVGNAVAGHLIAVGGWRAIDVYWVFLGLSTVGVCLLGATALLPRCQRQQRCCVRWCPAPGRGVGPGAAGLDSSAIELVVGQHATSGDADGSHAMDATLPPELGASDPTPLVQGAAQASLSDVPPSRRPSIPADAVAPRALLWRTLSVMFEPNMRFVTLLSASNGVHKGFLYAGFNIMVGEVNLGFVFTTYGVALIITNTLTGTSFDWLRNHRSARDEDEHVQVSFGQRMMAFVPYALTLVGLLLAVSADQDHTWLLYAAAVVFGIAGGSFEPLIFAYIDALCKSLGRDVVSAAFGSRALIDSVAFTAVVLLGQGNTLSPSVRALIVAGLHVIAIALMGRWDPQREAKLRAKRDGGERFGEGAHVALVAGGGGDDAPSVADGTRQVE